VLYRAYLLHLSTPGLTTGCLWVQGATVMLLLQGVCPEVRQGFVMPAVMCVYQVGLCWENDGSERCMLSILLWTSPGT
jgi:hypothetical protein